MSVDAWLKRLKRVPLWRLVFICPMHRKTCFPLVHRDDRGFWNACRLCGHAKGRNDFEPFAKRSSEGVTIPANPYERPYAFHFECPVCGFTDEESRKLARPLDVFCTLCRADNGHANSLVRWPPVPGMSRAAAFEKFRQDPAFDAVNDAFPQKDWRPAPTLVDMLEKSPISSKDAKEGAVDDTHQEEGRAAGEAPV